MIILIKNAAVYAPEYLGMKDVLLAGDKIYRIMDHIEMETNVEVELIDAKGQYLFPGFIDSHVHITGGGGEGSFHTRTPEIMLSDITLGGVTTVIGTLGTDGTTRTMTNLLAKANALAEEGITTFVNTGSYQIPVRTLTGSIVDDIILIDKIIGVGEVAVSDHRSSQPTLAELTKVAAEARLGGMLSGKSGTVNIHMGDSKRMLDLVEEIIASTEIPIKHFVPTHMNRNPYLFEKALDFGRQGGFVDFTTSTVPLFIEEGEIPAYHTLKCFIDQGIVTDGVTFSSDGQGSLPMFNEQGEMTGIDIGRVTSLYQAVRDAVLIDGIAIETAVSVITKNPAVVYNLKTKGQIAAGFDADLVLVNKSDMTINTVLANGKVMVADGKAVVKGTFEK